VRPAPLRAALAVALVLAAGAASAQVLPAFTRTTTCDGDPAAGNTLWWAGSPPVVTWTLYTGHVPPGCTDLATLEALTAASYAAWSSQAHPDTGAVSGFAFQHTAANRTTDPTFGNDGRNLVTWRHGLCQAISAQDPCHGASTCQDLHNCWDETGTIDPTGDVLALTWVTFQSNGQIVDADLELNDWNGLGTTATAAGFSYTCSAPRSSAVSICSCTTGDGDKGGCTSASTACVWADVGAIVTHEAGHVLGLDHPASGCPTTCAETMAPRIPLGTTDKRALSTEDRRGVCAIYPGSGAATRPSLGACGASPSPLSRASNGCGCGGDPSTALWALLGPLLLWRKRRRA